MTTQYPRHRTPSTPDPEPTQATERSLEEMITKARPGEKVADFFLRFIQKDIEILEEGCRELEHDALVGELVKSVTLAERRDFLDTLKHYHDLRRIELGLSLDDEGGDL